MSTNGTPPGAPDYSALASQTAASNAAATAAQTANNRPNQTDPFGNTSTWTQDPTTGQWSQKVSLSAGNQGFTGSKDVLRDTLLGQVSSANQSPLDFSGSQAVGDPNQLGGGGFNMDPTGNSSAIQDATYKLLQPQREQTREAEIQRLKNQGLTEGSEAFQRGMTRLDQGDTDAQLRSLLAGTTEYGNTFNRAAGQNAQNFGQKSQQLSLAQALRQSQNNEALTKRNAPLAALQQLMQQQTTPQFGQFIGAGNPGGTDFLGAGQNSYNASLGGYNATEASRAGNISGFAGLLGGLLGAPKGTGGNDLVNWFTGLFNSPDGAPTPTGPGE